MDKKLSERILASAGAKKASLVLKHGTVVNVFTAGLEQADIAIEDGCIVGLGDYEGVTEIDLKGAVVCPSLIDGHIHLESSMWHRENLSALSFLTAPRPSSPIPMRSPMWRAPRESSL